MNVIVTDENVDLVINQYLRENKYNILSVRDESPGISDKDVIKITISNHNYPKHLRKTK